MLHVLQNSSLWTGSVCRIKGISQSVSLISGCVVSPPLPSATLRRSPVSAHTHSHTLTGLVSTLNILTQPLSATRCPVRTRLDRTEPAAPACVEPVLTDVLHYLSEFRRCVQVLFLARTHDLSALAPGQAVCGRLSLPVCKRRLTNHTSAVTWRSFMKRVSTPN